MQWRIPIPFADDPDPEKRRLGQEVAAIVNINAEYHREPVTFTYAEIAEWIGEDPADVAAALQSIGGDPESITVDMANVVALSARKPDAKPLDEKDDGWPFDD